MPSDGCQHCQSAAGPPGKVDLSVGPRRIVDCEHCDGGRATPMGRLREATVDGFDPTGGPERWSAEHDGVQWIIIDLPGERWRAKAQRPATSLSRTAETPTEAVAQVGQLARVSNPMEGK